MTNWRRNTIEISLEHAGFPIQGNTGQLLHTQVEEVLLMAVYPLVWLPAFLWQCSAQLSPGAGLRPTCVNGISKHFITSTRPMELILSTTAPILPNKVNMFQSKRTERLISHSQPMHYSAQYKLQQQGMYVAVS